MTETTFETKIDINRFTLARSGSVLTISPTTIQIGTAELGQVSRLTLMCYSSVEGVSVSYIRVKATYIKKSIKFSGLDGKPIETPTPTATDEDIKLVTNQEKTFEANNKKTPLQAGWGLFNWDWWEDYNDVRLELLGVGVVGGGEVPPPPPPPPPTPPEEEKPMFEWWQWAILAIGILAVVGVGIYVYFRYYRKGV
jgi:hypothetical protein